MLKPKRRFKRHLKVYRSDLSYVLFALEENTIHLRSKPEDLSTESSPHQFGPPNDNPHWHHQKE
jgi:hypothetical protein